MFSDIQNNNTIHVVFSIWNLADSYNKYAGTAITSLLKNTYGPVEIHLLYDENYKKNDLEYDANREKYKILENRFNTKITCHHVEMPAWCSTLPKLRFFTLGTLLRLMLPDVLPEIHKVIYLDCDVIVRKDIRELWDVDMGKYCLGAYLHENGDEFNAGVLLMDLAGIRKRYEFSKQTLAFLANHPNTQTVDQAALNSVFKEDYYHLDKKYNLTTENHGSLGPDDVVLHFSWIKPWKIYQDFPGYYEFWKYFSETPWCCDATELLKEVSSVSNFSSEQIIADTRNLIYIPLGMRLNYFFKFSWSFIMVNVRELIVRVFHK